MFPRTPREHDPIDFVGVVGSSHGCDFEARAIDIFVEGLLDFPGRLANLKNSFVFFLPEDSLH
jgi:hypothetical protein